MSSPEQRRAQAPQQVRERRAPHFPILIPAYLAEPTPNFCRRCLPSNKYQSPPRDSEKELQVRAQQGRLRPSTEPNLSISAFLVYSLLAARKSVQNDRNNV